MSKVFAKVFTKVSIVNMVHAKGEILIFLAFKSPGDGLPVIKREGNSSWKKQHEINTS